MALLSQTPSLGHQLSAYGKWRDDLLASVRRLQAWIDEQSLGDAQTAMQLERLADRLRDDKLRVAFVAEFSRGKSELINALFFADYGQRILPTSAGRTTMCPTEIGWDAGCAPSIRLLPIETRRQPESLAEWKEREMSWTHIPLDIQSPESLSRTLSHVSETLRVTVAEAASLGLNDTEQQLGGTVVPIDGKVEIPRWRHAVINFPHPLLKEGLVVLDTPGLNAIGAEPELTLSLLPQAHAIVFILAADAGVTRTDAALWRSHIAGAGAGPMTRGRLVALNKIDSMWDELKPAKAVDAEIARQVGETAVHLGIPEGQIFPVSAQKALVAKVNGDAALLVRSRIKGLEQALAGDLIPTKHELVGEACRTDLREIVARLVATLDTRARNLQEQITELDSLRGKNEDVVATMLGKISGERERFEAGLRRYVALQRVFTKHTNELLSLVGLDTLKREAKRTREEMEGAHFTIGLRAAMSGFFSNVRANMLAATTQAGEIHQMMVAMYGRLSKEHGLEPFEPKPYSMVKYQKEIDRLERAYNVHFNTLWNMASNVKFSLMRKFFDTVANRLRHIYEIAGRDAENWVRSVIAPMETQMRERQSQLRRRLESIKRIQGASDDLENRMSELEEMRANAVDLIEDLKKLAGDIEVAVSLHQTLDLAAGAVRAA